MPSESIKSFRGQITEGNSKILSDENCVRMVNCIALENKFLTRAGYKKYNSVQYDGRINLIYDFRRIVGGNLKILAFGTKLAVGTPTYTSLPSANAGADQSKNTGDTVTLDGSASARAVSYLWTQTSGTTVTLSDTTVVSPTFTMPAGNVSFSLKVTNFWGNDTDTVDILYQIYGEDDSDVNFHVPDTNYGNTYHLDVQRHHLGGYRKRFFIKKPSEATTLHIYLFSRGWYSTPSLGVYAVSSSWSEEIITWNNQPSRSFIKSVTPTLGWMTFDLSSHINYGSFCFDFSTYNRWAWLSFYSKENSDTTKRPYWS